MKDKELLMKCLKGKCLGNNILLGAPLPVKIDAAISKTNMANHPQDITK